MSYEKNKEVAEISEVLVIFYFQERESLEKQPWFSESKYLGFFASLSLWLFQKVVTLIEKVALQITVAFSL